MKSCQFMTKTMNFVKISVFRLFEHVVFIAQKSVFLFVRKDPFLLFWREKIDLQTRKLKLKKKKTIDSFPKALVKKFCPKWSFFSSVFFKKIMLIFWISKKTILKQKTKVLTRIKKKTFSKGVSQWLLSKNRT